MSRYSDNIIPNSLSAPILQWSCDHQSSSQPYVAFVCTYGTVLHIVKPAGRGDTYTCTVASPCPIILRLRQHECIHTTIFQNQSIIGDLDSYSLRASPIPARCAFVRMDIYHLSFICHCRCVLPGIEYSRCNKFGIVLVHDFAVYGLPFCHHLRKGVYDEICLLCHV